MIMHYIMWANFKVLMNPLDRMKVLLQSHLEVCSTLNPHERSMLPAELGTVRGTAKHIWATEGFHGLWRGSLLGWSTSFIHSFGSIAMMWWVDWMTKPKVGYAAYDRNRDGNIIKDENPEFFKRAIYSGIGGFALSVALYPIDLMRTVRMADLKFPQVGRVDFQHPTLLHFTHALNHGSFLFRTVPRTVIDDVSVGSHDARMKAFRYACLWRGYGLSLLGMMLYRGIHLFMATLSINVVLRAIRDPETQGPSAMTELAIGFGVTMGATALVYPLDTLRARFIRLGFGNSPMPAGGEYMPVREMARMIFAREGWSGFYRGASFALTMRAATLAGAAFGIPAFTNWMISGGQTTKPMQGGPRKRRE